MRLSEETSNWRTIAWLAISLACLCFGTTAFADHDHRGKSERHHQRHDRHDHRKHSSKHTHDHRHAHRKSYSRYESKHYDHRHHDAGWHYRRGRHWAPANYRGRYCTDRRHFHDVHYRVAYDDYYEYYYPRYRYYGPYTRGATLIITVPLF